MCVLRLALAEKMLLIFASDRSWILSRGIGQEKVRYRLHQVYTTNLTALLELALAGRKASHLCCVLVSLEVFGQVLACSVVHILAALLRVDLLQVPARRVKKLLRAIRFLESF